MFSDVPLTCSLDLEAPGKQFGAIDLFVSDDDHGYASIPLPIVCIANGTGPTILVSGGNHGNEVEGQLIVRRLIAQMQPDQINGRLLLLPALNLPAVRAFSRVSPLDGGNLNRSFPGTTHRGPTSQIAHFLSTVLMPLCDAGIDLHSGGPAMRFVNSAYLGIGGDATVRSRSLALARALGLPFTLVCNDGGVGMDDAAHACGVPFVSTEFGGGISTDRALLDQAYRAVRRMLHATGVLAGPAPDPAPAATRFLDFDHVSQVQAPVSGLFEPHVDLGDSVAAGDSAGLLYSIEETDRPPVPLHFKGGGIVAVARGSARVRAGDYIFSVAAERSLAAIEQACGKLGGTADA